MDKANALCFLTNAKLLHCSEDLQAVIFLCCNCKYENTFYVVVGKNGFTLS